MLPSCFSSADIFVLPYKGGYQKSGPLHRALASGRAIIASDLQSVREVIKHGYNGMLFKPNNVDELANLILELYKDEDKRKELSKNAREFAEKYLDFNIIAKQTVKVYEEVLS
jgi:glycosyltransferase involved in cell wall biosynthesis